MVQPSPVVVDRAHDILRRERRPLDAIFRPASVAVVGATEKAGSVGRTVLANLIATPFGGTVFPVNPTRRNVLGVRAYRRVVDVPEPVDLAVIVTPAPTVPAVMEDCVAAGVHGAIVISAGFKELGPPGEALERQVLDVARRGRMRLIGPNCLGVMNPISGMNATFAKGIARPGRLAFLSQSGALLTSVLDWSLLEQVGFSSIVSLGSMLDVGFGDLIDYLGDDPRTESILVYMESVGDARAFLSAAREVALTKPIILIKAGRTEAAAQAAASHTGSLTGSDDVLDAALRRTGVLRVESIADLFSMAEVLGKQPRPPGPRLAVVTNAGGPGVLATDAHVLAGGEMAELSPSVLDELNRELPPPWSHGNPVDVLGDAGPDRYAKAVQTVARDPNNDGLLVILTPQDMTDPTGTADKLKRYAHVDGKPVLASFMGGADVEAAVDILNRAGIPTFPFPDSAARAFQYMVRYSYHLKGLYETPTLLADERAVDREGVSRLVDDVRRSGRTLLTEEESKRVLSLYGIPTVETRIARTADEAAAAADEIGYPVVVKLLSETVTHKSDVGGVRLDLRSADEVYRTFLDIEETLPLHVGPGHFDGVTVQPMIRREGYELILGSSVDPQFGPVLLFGTGGQLVEVYHDVALGLPPLNATLARRMMEQTRVFHALEGVRGQRPIDREALAGLCVRFSQLVVEQPAIAEIDINPLLASPDAFVALDARVVLQPPDVEDRDLPRPAIRPYPIEHISSFALDDGTHITLRPIRPEDEPLLVRFHEKLSERTVRQRYFRPLQLGQRVAHERLASVCFVDYDREMVLVAVTDLPNGGRPELLGVGRLSRLPGLEEAEFALLVADPWQRKGIGGELLRRLVDIARHEGITRVTADILPDNLEMQRLSERVGFALAPADGVMHAEIRP